MFKHEISPEPSSAITNLNAGESSSILSHETRKPQVNTNVNSIRNSPKMANFGIMQYPQSPHNVLEMERGIVFYSISFPTYTFQQLLLGPYYCK